VSPEKIDRLPGFCFFNRQKQALDFFDDVTNSAWSLPPAFESGGGGLLSPVHDSCAFSHMMLNKGKCEGGEILSRASVELMTSDQVSAPEREGADIFFGDFS